MAIAVVIRVDGGPEIGFGHLVRSSALATEILTAGHTVTVATTTPDTARAVFPKTVDTVNLSSRSDPKPFVEWLDTVSPDIVFTDAYPVDTQYQKAVRKQVPLAVLQDDSRHAVCADLFVNGNLYANDMDYEFVGRNPNCLFGPQYLLLREEIRKRIGEKDTFLAHPESLLLLMGGSDVRNSTPTVIEAIDASQYDKQITVVLGPGCDNLTTVYETASTVTQPIKCVYNPDDLADLMVNSDIAITSTGTTVYELLGLQTPFVGIPQISNQDLIGDSLDDRGLAYVLEKQASKDKIINGLNELLRDLSFRRHIHEIGPTVVDGRGTIRVTNQVQSLGDS